MKNVRTALFAGLALGLSAQSIEAKEPSYRPAFEASPETRQRYVELAKAARPPLRRSDSLVVEGKSRTAVGALFRVEDGAAIIGVPLSSAQAAVLTRRGVAVVRSKANVRNNTIYERHYYRMFVALPSVSLDHLAGQIGQTVRLELKATEAGYLRIASATVKR